MPESSQSAKMAASLILRANPVDDEATRILLALNDAVFASRLLAENLAQGRTITPEAWKSLCQGGFRTMLADALQSRFTAALRENNFRSAKHIAFHLLKLKLDKDDQGRLSLEALGHNNIQVAAWIMLRPHSNIDRPSVNRWIAKNPELASGLADELAQQIERTGVTNGKKAYLDGLIEDIRLIIKDNAELRDLLKHGAPDEIADALHNCMLVTSESIEALDQFAWDRPECVADLVRLIHEDAKEIEQDGAPKAVGNFFRNLARNLTQHAEAAMTAARVGA